MSIFKKAGLYWHTLKYLRPIQFTGRLRFWWSRPKPNLTPPPPLRPVVGSWQTPASRSASLIGPGHFLFLGQQGSLEADGWDNIAQTKLWRYNQHYFDDLNAVGADARRDWHQDLIARWIRENPPGEASGWEPYPTSLRIVNWVKAARSGFALSEAAKASLAVQARWLTRRLEWHLLGNHLFANAKALIFAGCYFDGPEAAQWHAMGRKILLDEIPEQILQDGGQFELSPMYHALALEDLLDLINILRAHGEIQDKATAHLMAACEARVPKMLSWLQAMSHPDDRITFFNDAAFGIAQENAALRDFAMRLGFTTSAPLAALTHLRDSGYVRLGVNPAVLFCDVAKVGPDYLPGHAHADTLSFELSVFNQRVVVNSGTSEYGQDPERLRQRGTAAHSSVVVCGENSSEVWGGFRVARRAYVQLLKCQKDGAEQIVEATHDGFARLPGSPTHSRKWTLSDNSLSVIDAVNSREQAVAFFHLHPDIEIQQLNARQGLLVLSGGQVLKWVSDCGVQTVEGTWHPEFGKSIPNRYLEIQLVDGKSKFELIWQ
jgi:uncharacterized heparinase superfamily protein